jgi:hypothetical protein
LNFKNEIINTNKYTFMKTYDTLSEAINDLVKMGYTYDFNLKPESLECSSHKLTVQPEEFKIDETYRFEGMSSAGDNSVLYAISSNNNIKGLLVDAYGVYAENITEVMRKKLR